MSDDTVNFHAATTHMAAGGARWGGGTQHVCVPDATEIGNKGRRKKRIPGICFGDRNVRNEKKRKHAAYNAFRPASIRFHLFPPSINNCHPPRSLEKYQYILLRWPCRPCLKLYRHARR
ncbi:unnamed protein product [Ectocarpus sp. 12 AP-2014]